MTGGPGQKRVEEAVGWVGEWIRGLGEAGGAKEDADVQKVLVGNDLVVNFVVLVVFHLFSLAVVALWR